MRRALVAVGVGVMGVGMVGALLDAPGAFLFLAGVLVAHDAVLMPLVLAAGALVGRFVPARARTAVRVAGLSGLAVTVVALPLVLGVGRVPDDPSVLPRPYGQGLLMVLALLAGFTMACAMAAHAVAASREPPPD